MHKVHFEYSPAQSPSFGNDPRSLAEINQLNVVDDFSEIGKLVLQNCSKFDLQRRWRYLSRRTCYKFASSLTCQICDDKVISSQNQTCCRLTCYLGTWLKASEPFSLKNKKVFRAERQNSLRCGLITAVRQDIPAQLISLPPSEVEVLAVKIWLGTNSVFPLTVINLYSPGGKFEATWLDSLYSQISSPFVFLGDFNIHHPPLGSSHSSSDANLVLDWISTKNMCLLNTNRFTKYQGTPAPSLLDLSICSADIVNTTSIEISHNLYDSDHCPIFISLSKFGTKSLLTRKYINWGKFSKQINAHLLNQGEVSYLEEVTQIFQESAKSSSYSFTRFAHTHSPWWDVKCSHLKALKRKLLRKAKSYPSITNWAAYKDMAAALRKYVKSCKRSFWEKTCQEAASSHQAFRIVKAILNKDGCTTNFVLSSGITMTAPTAQANAIEGSLIKKAPDERIPLDFSAYYLENSDDQTLNRPFSFKEFHNLLAKTRNKSPGIDQRVYSGTPGWVGRRHFFRPLTTSAILIPVFPTGWDLARSKKGIRFLASSVPGVNAIR
ncbi:hypothetical protein AVEN_269114-1 [Araneus ventricosus]|uniref:Endonuclease/exonuclease/phosphatase domain-containing protein n=1 Tax=Araneus ventricosus TaxID=182803 RepID=A0A4Y2PI12_ARAVE|nr:hypothetical protein AVEN_269114-1 [Araneus ventricosus]